MSLTENYVHTRPKKERNWDQDYLQVVAVDPGQVNFAFRIERRYKDGKIKPIAFWKEEFKYQPYCKITAKLDEFLDDFRETHVFLVEKQPPRSVAINRIMQHALSYFINKTQNFPLLPAVYEMSAKIKGRELGYDRSNNLKNWASIEARKLLNIRNDKWSLEVMDRWLIKPPLSERRGKKLRNIYKDDDLADTIVMIEAYCKIKGHPLTKHATIDTMTNEQDISKQKKESETKKKKLVIKKVKK